MDGDGGTQLSLPSPTEEPSDLCFSETCWAHRWCLKLAPHPARKVLTAIVTLLQCLALCSYDPCADTRDALLSRLDHVFFVFFLVEMSILTLAQGFKVYIQNNWNKLDALIVISEFFGYAALLFHWDLTVVLDPLRPLRLIRRIPSLQKNMEIIAGTVPMFARVTLLNVLLHVIFGVISVQLWKGQLYNRCFLGPEDLPILQAHNKTMSDFYDNPRKLPFLCTTEDKDGRHCTDVPSSVNPHVMCDELEIPSESSNSSCTDWNLLYDDCRRGPQTPYRGAISFDDIGHALITIFQVITLEGWSEIMYFVMDTYSFWSFTFFIVVTVIGAFVMMNVVAVVVTTQFAECKKKYLQKHGSEERTALETILACKRHLQEKYRCPFNFQRIRLDKMKKIADHHIFDNTILFIVCLSIVALALEHHKQPMWLTNTLHYSNIVINVIFIVEMAIRILADSYEYFTNVDTLADFLIVISSSIEMMVSSEGVFAMLRAFRLLRLVRLIKFLPYMRKQVNILLQTMKQATSLLLMMLLFVFAFSLLGCHLFGCKFKFLIEDGLWRKNFDNVMWGMVTVFQILTLEDWNFVLYNAIVSTTLWSAIYFVIVIMLGKNLLLNVLVGIVVDNFHAHEIHEPEASENGNHHSSVIPYAEQVCPDAEETIHIPWYLVTIPWCLKYRAVHSLFLFGPDSRFRELCRRLTFSSAFDHLIMLLIGLSCITLAMERPDLQPFTTERIVLTYADFIFAGLFFIEMVLKVVAQGLVLGPETYCRNPWNIMDGLLVILSGVDVIVTLSNDDGENNVLGILKVLRLFRALRPLRVLQHAPLLKLAIDALLASVGPIINIVLITSVFMFMYAILGAQLFSGSFYNCVDEELQDVRNNTNIINEATCLMYNHTWTKRTYTFDNVFQALMSLFVMYSKDGWVNIMYDGIDAVGADIQPVTDHQPWMALFFIVYMIVSYFLLDMFIGTLVDTWFRKVKEKKQKGELMRERRKEQTIPRCQWASRYIPMLDKLLSVIIIINLFIMALEHNDQPRYMNELMDKTFYVVTAIFIFELLFKMWVLGFKCFFTNKWNQLEFLVVVVSLVSIFLSVLNLDQHLPFNPSAIRSIRLFSLAHLMRSEKIQILLRTVGKTLSQGKNLCLLFGFFFFIYAVLTVELFGGLECTEDYPCEGLNRYSNFKNFGMALLALFKMCTGDNWNGILKDALRECRPGDPNCTGYLWWAAPLCLISFAVMVQFVLVNLIVAAIMEAQEESLIAVPRANAPCPFPESSSESDSVSSLTQGESTGNWLQMTSLVQAFRSAESSSDSSSSSDSMETPERIMGTTYHASEALYDIATLRQSGDASSDASGESHE